MHVLLGEFGLLPEPVGDDEASGGDGDRKLEPLDEKWLNDDDRECVVRDHARAEWIATSGVGTLERRVVNSHGDAR